MFSIINYFQPNTDHGVNLLHESNMHVNVHFTLLYWNCYSFTTSDLAKCFGFTRQLLQSEHDPQLLLMMKSFL